MVIILFVLQKPKISEKVCRNCPIVYRKTLQQLFLQSKKENSRAIAVTTYQS